MINIKGGVVSIGRNDTLSDVSISNAMVVVDMDDVKSEQEVKDFMTEHLDNVELHSCDVVTNEVYADFVMKKAESRAKRDEALKEIEKMVDHVREKIEPVANYRAPLIERVVGNPKFWLVLIVMHVLNLFGVLQLGPTAWAALMAVSIGSFAANMHFAVKRFKRMKFLMTPNQEK